MITIFFDIGDTLATPVFENSTGQLINFNVLPHVMETLETLKKRALRMGIISNAGNIKAEEVNNLLDACGLLGFFDPAIVIYRKKDSPEIFAEAARQAGAKPEECLFVGENRDERERAARAGLTAVARPDLVLRTIDGKNRSSL